MSYSDQAVAEAQPQGDRELSRPRVHVVVINRDTPPSMLLNLLAVASDTGVHLLIKENDKDGPVLGALLPKVEYELLNAAATLASQPDRYRSLLDYIPDKVLTLQDVFPE